MKKYWQVFWKIVLYKEQMMVFHNLLLVMSLSGSIVFILYVLLYPVTRRYFSQKWRYRVLKIAAVFYLVPFSEYKYRVVGLTRTVFPHFLEKVWHISETIDTEYMIITRPEHIEISPKVSCLRILMLLSVIFTPVYNFWNFLKPDKM